MLLRCEAKQTHLVIFFALLLLGTFAWTKLVNTERFERFGEVRWQLNWLIFIIFRQSWQSELDVESAAETGHP